VQHCAAISATDELLFIGVVNNNGYSDLMLFYVFNVISFIHSFIHSFKIRQHGA